MTPDESLEKAKQHLNHDMASITYRGSVAAGKNGMVSIDIESRELIVRYAPDTEPICRLRLPKQPGPDQLSRLFKEIAPPPILCDAGAFLDDLTAVFMVYLTQSQKPDLSQIRLSPEAAALLSKPLR